MGGTKDKILPTPEKAYLRQKINDKKHRNVEKQLKCQNRKCQNQTTNDEKTAKKLSNISGERI